MVTALAMLRRRINSSESAVYRLHPEVLSLVASYLPRETLIKATHVSHRWRAILLAFPNLWTDLNFRRGEEALVFLERSKSRPLSVSATLLPYYSSKPFTGLTFLENHAAKIETFAISGLQLSALVHLSPLVSLRTLDISFGGTIGYLPYTDDRTEAKLSLPSLTVLTLREGGTFPFNVPQLTQLQVYSSGTLAARKLLHFLNHSPLLEELEVGYSSELVMRDDNGTVELPRLRLYTHHTKSVLRLALLDKLRLPPSCSIVFNYLNRPTDAHSAHDDMTFYNPSPLTNVKRIYLEATDGEGGSVDATVELIDAKNNRVRMMKNIDRGILERLPFDRDTVDELYAAHIKCLDSRTVEVLCIDGPESWPFESAKKLLSCLGEVRTLVLSGDFALQYLENLSPGPGGNGFHAEGLSTDQWQCTKLESLVVHSRVLFYGPNSEDIVKRVLNVAQRRKDAGIPLKSVSLFIFNTWTGSRWGPVGSRRELEQLRGCVEKVETAFGDCALDWDTDDYFFDGLPIRRDRYLFPEHDSWWKSIMQF